MGLSQETLLALSLLLHLFTQATVLLLWRHIDARAAEQRGFEVRLAKVEAEQKVVMTPAEVRALHERLAEFKGQMTAITTLMHAIQEHLLTIEQKGSGS